ncbi:MFS transporter [Paenibacillus sp. J31TS4]|nr:MFS transporter [Paenibacillus sp. J31TS4]
MFSLLTIPDFRRFWIAQVISQLGDGMARTTITYLVSVLSGDPLAIGLVIVLQLLPGALFSIWTGPLADRYSRRRLMAGAELYSMLCVLAMLPFLHSLPLLLVLIGLQGIGSAVFDPSRTASVPDLVGSERVTQAVSFSQSTSTVLSIAGPSAGALLLALDHLPLVFWINGATFLLSALLLLTLPPLHPAKGGGSGTAPGESYLASLRSGIRSVLALPVLRFLLLLVLPVCLTVGVINTLLVAVMTQSFSVTASLFGLLQASVGAGAVAGAAFLGPWLLRRSRANWLLVLGAAGIGFWMILVLPLAAIRPLWGMAPVFVWCIMGGVLNALINVPLNSLFLCATPASYRGRSASLFKALTNTSILAGVLGGGLAASYAGPLSTMAAAGCLLVLSICVFPALAGWRALGAAGGRGRAAYPETEPASAPS